MTSTLIDVQLEPLQRTQKPLDETGSEPPTLSGNSSVENEPEPTLTFPPDDSEILMEETVVEDDDAYTKKEEDLGEKKLAPVSEEPPVQLPEKGHEETGSELMDPLHVQSGKEAQGVMMVTEEERATIPMFGMLYSELKGTHTTTASKRTSHLRLDIRPPSPQPWELIDPPKRYSPIESQNLRKLQNRKHTRSLIPKSSYYFGPPPADSAFGSPPIGQIGVHHPREIIRIERDYTGGELTQFAPIYPLELEGRITPTHFLESINEINEVLISAHSLRHSFLDNVLAIFSLQLSRLFFTSHYDQEMQRLQHLIQELNIGLYNPVGLNILWPRDVAFLFLEIEYYVSSFRLFYS